MGGWEQKGGSMHGRSTRLRINAAGVAVKLDALARLTPCKVLEIKGQSGGLA